MKRFTFILLILTVLIGISCSGLIANAQGLKDTITTKLDTTIGEQGAGLQSGDLSTTVANIISTMLGLIGIILVIVIIYAGFLWMTAGGNPEQVKKGQAWLKNGVIGVVIILMAYAITNFIISIL